jgi:hypothetical protein
MKLTVCLCKFIEIENNDPIFEKIKNIHAENIHNNAEREDYQKAMEIVEKSINLPAYPFPNPSSNNQDYITAVYTEDDIPILEI